MTSGRAAASGCSSWRSARSSTTRTAWGRSNSTASTGLQQHNVYMQGFLVYGWLGGAAYLALVAITLLLGLLDGLGADAMAVLSDHRLRGVRRRGLRRA